VDFITAEEKSRVLSAAKWLFDQPVGDLVVENLDAGRQLDTGLCFRDGGTSRLSPSPGGGLAFFRAELTHATAPREALPRPRGSFELRRQKVLKDSKSSKAGSPISPASATSS
jgi:hypothetical protein